MVNGLIFDTNFTKPAATLSTPVYGADDMKQTFRWVPSCDQAQTVPYQFQIRVTDQGCRPKSVAGAFVINVVPPSEPTNLSGVSSLCANAKGISYSVDNVPGTTYIWKINNGVITSGDSTSKITVDWGNGGGTVQAYTVTKNGCKSDSVSLSIRASTFPIDAGNDTTLCLGDSLTLGGNPTGPSGFVFSWSPNTFFLNGADTNAANPKILPLASTAYFLKVTDTANNCVMLDTIRVTVKQGLNAGAGKDTTICSGNQAQLTSFGGKSYSWEPSGLVLAPNDSNTLTRVLTASTDFIVVIKGDTGSCATIDTQKVTVLSPSAIDAGRDTNICMGDTFFLGGNPTGPVGSTFSWNTSAGIDDSSKANPMYIANAPDTSTYIVTVSQSGCSFKDTINVRRDSLPQVAAALFPTAICSGDSAAMGATGASMYSWSPSLDFNFGADSATGIVYPKDTTTWTVTGTNTTGCSAQFTLTLNVNPIPKIEKPTDSVFLCFGDTLNVTTTAGAKKYKWTPNTNILPHDSIANPKLFPSTSTKYIVQMDSLGICSAKDSIMIIVDNKVPTDAGRPQTVCAGDTFVLSGNPTALQFNTTFSWTPASLVLNPTDSSTKAFTNADTTFKVTTRNGSCIGEDSVRVTLNIKPTITYSKDTYRICPGDTAQFVVLSEGPITGYQWSPGATLSDSTIKNPRAFPTVFTKYTVTVTHPNTCTDTRDVFVSLDGQPNISAGTDASACEGQPFQLNASGATKYKWTPSTGLSNDTIANPVATIMKTTTYIVTGTSSSNCSASDSIKLTVNPVTKIDAGGTIISCDADTVQLGGNPTAPPKSKFAWSSPEVLDNPSIANPTSFYTLNRVYFLLVVDSNGCESIDSATVLRFTISAEAEAVDCSKDSVQLSIVKIDGTKPYTYQWSPNYNIGNTTIPNPSVAPDSTFTYTVMVKDSVGCEDSVRVTVPVTNPVKALFDVLIQASCDDAVANTNNTSLNADQYKWFVDDVLVSEEYNARIPLQFNSSKKITLLAASSDGCRDSSSSTQDVLAFEDYFNEKVPNVFTPNGDGINDVFDVQLGQRLEQCSNVRVFNRWGQLMFESHGNSHTWDGRTFAGEECKAGVYFFVLDINGTTYKGNVTLLR